MQNSIRSIPAPTMLVGSSSADIMLRLYPQAIAQANLAYAYNPTEAYPILLRSRAEQASGDLNAALRDLNWYRKNESYSDHADYAAISMWDVLVRLNRGAEAHALLADAYINTWQHPKSDWTSIIAEYLLGWRTEAEMDVAATDPDPEIQRYRKCEEFYYVGIMRASVGDISGATASFHRCLSTQKECYAKYAFSVEWLATLNRYGIADTVP